MKTKKAALLAFAVFLLFSSVALANPIYQMRQVPSCVRINNTGDFPAAYFIGESILTNDANGANTTSLLIADGGCIKTPGIGPFNLYWADKEYIDSVGGLGGIKKGRIPINMRLVACEGECYRNGITDSSLHFITDKIYPAGTGSVEFSDNYTVRVIKSYELQKNGSGYSLEWAGDVYETAGGTKCGWPGAASQDSCLAQPSRVSPKPAATGGLAQQPASFIEGISAQPGSFSGGSADMEGSYEQLFLYALFFTVAAETAALFLCARILFKMRKKEAPDALLLFCGIALSFATLPYVWFILPMFAGGTAYMACAELFAFAAEAIGYKCILRIGWKRAAALSLVCNASSFLLGLLFF
ncbi:MAG: hypothetical protein NTX79_03320 [Candidatus Micrarchaeota archaeon]|nr:hypothetical protein [Candidatus Micrarchaeota archaeon]